MQKSTLSGNTWPRQIAICIGYALIYSLLRPYSNGIWAVTAGLRLSCLLLFPYRYWPALIVGEFVPLAYGNYEHLDAFGTAWTVLNSIPPIPIVWWCRRQLSLFPSTRLVKVKPLLVCIALTSLVWTLVNFGVLATLVQPADAVPYHFHKLQIVFVFLGKYTGILTIVPLALLVKLQHQSTPWLKRINDMAKSRLVLDTIMLLVPTLAVLAWINQHASIDARQITRMAMFLPVAWLTLKHGWRAAALGTTIAMVCIFVSMASRPDPDLIEVQAFIAFAATCLFALGARITAQNAVEEQERLDTKSAVKLAQQGLYLCELRMRQTAQALEQISGTLHLTHNRLLDRFKHLLPTSESQNYFRQAAATQNQVYRLANSLHPIVWRERGLPAALNETIARTLDEAGIVYRCDLTGRGLSQLSPSVHAAIYRLACEAVIYVCEQTACTNVTLSLRGGLSNGQKWAVLRVEGTLQRADINDPVYKTLERQYLATKLGADGLDVDAMRDRVRLYSGELHVRSAQDKLEITALLQDMNKQVREHETAPARALYIR